MLAPGWTARGPVDTYRAALDGAGIAQAGKVPDKTKFGYWLRPINALEAYYAGVDVQLTGATFVRQLS